MGRNEVIEIPAEPADPAGLPEMLKGFSAVPPLLSDIDLSVDDRYLYASCWGNGEMRQYDVSDPFNPNSSAGAHRRYRQTHAASGKSRRRSRADRRWWRSAATAGASTSRTRSIARGTTSSTLTAWKLDGELDVRTTARWLRREFFVQSDRSIACIRCACRAGTPRRIRTAFLAASPSFTGTQLIVEQRVHNLAHPASAIESHDRAGIAQLDEEKFERVFCGGAPRGRRKIVSNVNEAIDVECAPLNAMHHVERFFSIARRNHIPGRLMLRLNLTSLKLPGAARHKVRVRHALVEGPVHKKIALTWEPEDRVIPRFTGRLTAAEKDDAVTTLTIEGRPSAHKGVALAAFDVIIGRKLAAATVQALLAEIREFVESDSRRR